jgi:hypothetical protein
MTLSYPLPTKGTTTSGFGYRTHPIKGGKKHHNGIDIGIPDGTKVYSVADGEVVRSDMKDRDGYGNYIIIKHNENGETFYSAYAHLTKRLVDVGDKVNKGDNIALSGGGQGMSGGGGLSTGPHLHFGISKSKDDDWVNPEPYLNKGEIVTDTDLKVDVKKDEDLTKDLNLTNLSDEKIKELLASLMKIPELGAKIRKERGLDENDQLNEEINRMKNLIKKIL